MSSEEAAIGATGTDATPRRIYLAGPIDYADDPRTWRDQVKRRWPEVDWIDPAEKFPDYEGHEAEVVAWGLKQARENDVLVNNIGDEGPETVGTHHEICEAIHAGNRIAVVPAGEPSPFVWCRDVELYDTIDAAVEALTGVVGRA